MRYVIDGRTIQDHFPGIARYTYNLVRALAQAAPDDELILLYDAAARNSLYPLAALDRFANVRLVTSAAPVFSLAEQWHIPRQLAALKPDLVHAPYYVRPYWAGVPVVFTAHDLIPLRCPQYLGVRERLVFGVAMRASLATARLVLADSQATAQDLHDLLRVRPDRIMVAPLAADPAFMPQPPAEVARVKGKYTLPDTYALYLGSNKPHKNLVRLVEAWADTRRQGATGAARLVIAGHWEARYPEAQVRAQQLGLAHEVVFAGPVAEADLPALYSGARLFVFPSLYEGFGLPVLEAMACGVPVACSGTSSLPEAAGAGALLFDPTHVDEMAGALRRLLTEETLRRELIAAGREHLRAFTWARLAKIVLAAYHRALAGPHASREDA